MQAFRKVVLLGSLGCVAVGCARETVPDRSEPTVAAVAGGDTLTTQRLADLMAASQVPMTLAVANAVTQRWISYRLLVETAARGDSLTRPSLVDSALSPTIDKMTVERFFARRPQPKPTYDSVAARAAYAAGTPLVMRHILVGAPARSSSVAQREAARARAEGIRRRVTPVNFAAIAMKESDDAETRGNGGQVPSFVRGTLPASIDSALLALPLGGISGVVETPRGAHVLLRASWEDAREEVKRLDRAQQLAAADSVAMAEMLQQEQVVQRPEAHAILLDVVGDMGGSLRDRRVIASATSGPLTAADVARLLHAMTPPYRSQMLQGVRGDSAKRDALIAFLGRSEFVARAARGAKAAPPEGEVMGMRAVFARDVRAAWRVLGVSPTILADSAATVDARRALGARMMDRRFQQIMLDSVPDLELPKDLERALYYSAPGYLVPAGVQQAFAFASRRRADMGKMSDSSLVDGAPVGKAP